MSNIDILRDAKKYVVVKLLPSEFSWCCWAVFAFHGFKPSQDQSEICRVWVPLLKEQSKTTQQIHPVFKDQRMHQGPRNISMIQHVHLHSSFAVCWLIPPSLRHSEVSTPVPPRPNSPLKAAAFFSPSPESRDVLNLEDHLPPGCRVSSLSLFQGFGP